MLPLILLVILVNLIALALASRSKPKQSRSISIVSTLFSLAISLILIYLVLQGGAPYQESYGTLTYLGLDISFTVSGLSAALLLMSTIVLFSATLAGNPEKSGAKLSAAMIALFEIAAVGLFTSSNLLLFFIFWDVGVIALFIMINVLGSANRYGASVNFLLYEIFASSLLLLAIILLYVYSPAHSLNIQYLASISQSLPINVQIAVFALLFIAFMTNMPIFPLHSWLPDAHTEASTQGSMMLSGILTKFGGYGMLLLFTMMPIASNYSVYIAVLAGFSCIYGAFIMIKQTDLKRIIAYSTIVEMGIILVAISAYNMLGRYGAVYGMVSHGLIISLAFLSIGIIHHLFGERSINRLRGILSSAKSSAYIFVIAAIAMVGFPLTSGFIADILIFLSALQSFGIYALAPLISIFIMGAYLYTVVSKCFISTSEISRSNGAIGSSQKVGYAVLAISIIVIGVLPFSLLTLMRI